MKLPCLASKIKSVNFLQNGSEAVFRARAGRLGAVEIETRQNIAEVDSLYLVHPWIDFLLDRHAIGNIVDLAPHEDEITESGEPPSVSFADAVTTSDSDSSNDGESLPSRTEPLMDAQMKLLARLRQPFRALLLAPARRNVEGYRRIITQNVIMAQVQEITVVTLNRSLRGVRVPDVLRHFYEIVSLLTSTIDI